MAFTHGYTDSQIEETHFDTRKIAELDGYFTGMLERNTIFGGGYLLAQGGTILAHKTLGKLTAQEGSADYLPGSIKAAESISKLFTATAIMQLCEQGRIHLDLPVSDILPEFLGETHKHITIFQLLTHTSGLIADPGYFGEAKPYQIFDGITANPQWLDIFTTGPLQAQPGTSWNYCSAGYMILAELVSRTSGMHFNDFVKANIIEPLQLERTFLEIPETCLQDTVVLHDWQNDYYASTRIRSEGKMPNGGGGVYTTMLDLFRLGQMFLNRGQLDGRRILSPRSVALMTTNQLEDVPGYQWGRKAKRVRQGLGWEFLVDHTLAGEHAFIHEGYGWSSLIVDPESQVVLVRIMSSPNAWSHELMIYAREIAFSGVRGANA